MIKGTNKYEGLGELLQGIYSLESLAERLKINKKKAVYVIHRLRKLGFVKTTYGKDKKRIYHISLKNKQNKTSYVEKMNEAISNPGIKLMDSSPHYIYGKEITYEDVLIYAIKKKSIRYIIASLALFRKISDWNYLYRLAKKEGLVVQVVALYEIARKTVRKVRKMPKRFIHQAQKIKSRHFQYIVKPLSSDDFNKTEKKWKIYIPLNRSDLEEYKR